MLVLPRVDLSGALLEQVVGRVSPPLRARLAWRTSSRRGDPAVRLLEELVAPGSVAVDCGASWGLFAHSLAGRVGASGRVHAFEPNSVNAHSLQRIASATGVVRVHRLALSDRPGRAELHMPRRRGRAVDAMGSMEVSSPREDLFTDTISVEVTTLDEALDDDVGKVGFVKCDVEGHELAVLRGGERTLGESRPALLVEIEQRHQNTDISVTFDHLLGLGYDGYMVRPGGLRPLAEFDVQADQLSLLDLTQLEPVVPREYVHDFVFVPPGADVARLLA